MLAAADAVERATRAITHGPFHEIHLGWRGWRVVRYSSDKPRQYMFGPTWSKKACRAYIAIMENVT